MIILVLFEQLLRQVLLNYFALNLEFFTKYRYDAFCSLMFDLCVLNIKRKGYYFIEEVQNYGKIVFNKYCTLLKMAGGCIPHTPH